MAYYIELSDTGEVKMMTRKMFQGPKEYYKITLTPSIKNTILNLAMNDSMYIKSNDTVPCICENLLYCLRLQYDTIDNLTGLLRPKRNLIQQRIINMMDSIWKNPIIKSETFFDLSQYEKNTEKELFTRGILVRDTMHYEKVIDMTEKK